MLFLIFVLYGVRGGIATEPELFDKLLALFIGVEDFEGFAFLIGDDVSDVFVKPLFPWRFQFFFERRFLSSFLSLSLSGLATVSRLAGAAFEDESVFWEMAGTARTTAKPTDEIQIDRAQVEETQRPLAAIKVCVSGGKNSALIIP